MTNCYFNILIFQMVAECLWKKFLPTFFGPFLKSFWPATSILKKPRFQVMLKWFSAVNQVWLKFRVKIPNLRLNIPIENVNHFDSLTDLFECYIPAVLWFEKTKASPSFDLRLRFIYIHLLLLSSLGSAPYVKVYLSFFLSKLFLGFIITIDAILFLGTEFPGFLGFATRERSRIF